MAVARTWQRRQNAAPASASCWRLTPPPSFPPRPAPRPPPLRSRSSAQWWPAWRWQSFCRRCGCGRRRTGGRGRSPIRPASFPAAASAGASSGLARGWKKVQYSISFLLQHLYDETDRFVTFEFVRFFFAPVLPSSTFHEKNNNTNLAKLNVLQKKLNFV